MVHKQDINYEDVEQNTRKTSFCSGFFICFYFSIILLLDDEKLTAVKFLTHSQTGLPSADQIIISILPIN